MSFSFEPPQALRPWGAVQPKFERLQCEGPDRYYLVYRAPSGEEVRVQLAPPKGSR